jgi:hypothetical protein
VSVFYSTPGHNMMTNLKAFFDSILARLPNGLQIIYPTSGDTIDSATGHLVGSWSGPTLATTIGSGNSPFPEGAGACITWNTNTINPGKPPTNRPFKVWGRTFLVPLNGDQYTNSGLLQPTAQAAYLSAATTLISATGGGMTIWSRNTKGASNGVAAPVLSATVHTKVAWLSSRRD